MTKRRIAALSGPASGPTLVCVSAQAPQPGQASRYTTRSAGRAQPFFSPKT